jgi:NAD(P)-dependent dehydrogenase (short-subunit alcohol dehydrogenase family)
MANAFLDDLALLVTGARRGIGEASLHVFAGYGAHLLLADIARDEAERGAESIRQSGGDEYNVPAK